MASKKTFKMDRPDMSHKRLLIRSVNTSVDVDVILDFDDVDHKSVTKHARKIERILNAHWNDPA